MGKWAKGYVGRWGVVLVWMGLIFVLSAQEQLPTPEERWLDFVLEKSAHTIEFAVLAILLSRALGVERSANRRSFLIAVSLAWLYALSDEFHQRFVPGRSDDWTDILFDWLGALTGVWLWLRWRVCRL